MTKDMPLLKVQGLNKVFQLSSGFLGVGGGRGSGKTTTGRLILRLIEPTSGAIKFDGVDLMTLKPHAMRPDRRRMQIVFQTHSRR